jgi:hypothetical protein
LISDSDPYTENVDADLEVDAAGGAQVSWWAGHDWQFALRLATFDAAGPVTGMTAPTGGAETSTVFPVGWEGTDNWSGVASYDVRLRTAMPQEPYGPWSTWQSGTVDTSLMFTGEPGSSYCFSARSSDTLGNVGSWSPARCASVPLDDTALTAGGSWSRSTHVGYFEKTMLSTSRHGARASLGGLHGRRLALLVATGPGNGTIQASFNGANLGTFSFASSQQHLKQVVPLADFGSMRGGRLILTVTSQPGAVVRIDGVLVER